MKFRGHLIGGVVAGAVVVGIAIQSGVVHIPASSPTELLQAGLNQQNGTLAAGSLFVLTLIMSLFPDLDTASVPQRWFFRSAFALLVVLLLLRQMDLFAIITLVLLLPLLHRHRGWTHSKITPIVISIFMLLALGYIRIPHLLDRLSVDLLVSLFRDTWVVVLACIIGHYTHLLLDSR